MVALLGALRDGPLTVVCLGPLTNLAMAIRLDPERTRNSLQFKLSAPKAGGPLQIVQDTGTGGSWPVSSDRASWALGAREVLAYLDGSARTAFRDQALEAMAETIRIDRNQITSLADLHDLPVLYSLAIEFNSLTAIEGLVEPAGLAVG